MGIYGTGKTKIQLCNDSGVEQSVYTLEYIDLNHLCQVKGFDVLDTEDILVLANGNTKKIKRGERVSIVIPVKYVDSFNELAWETFLKSICTWGYKIKVTPNVDKPAKTYWCTLTHTWDFDRSVRYLWETGELRFIGEEIITEV